MSTLLTLGASISNVFNTIYVEAVNTKHIHTFLPITFLIFNRFSIHKKFWKAETEGFSTMSSSIICVNIVNARHKYFWCIQCCMCWGSWYILYTIYPHVMVCMLMQSTQFNYNVDSSNKLWSLRIMLSMKIQLKALNYFEFQQTLKRRMSSEYLRALILQIITSSNALQTTVKFPLN